jgi:hypothetical protein
MSPTGFPQDLTSMRLSHVFFNVILMSLERTLHVSILARQHIFDEDDENKMRLPGKLPRYCIAARRKPLKIKHLSNVLAAVQHRRIRCSRLFLL